jgi:hypothetical protein
MRKAVREVEKLVAPFVVGPVIYRFPKPRTEIVLLRGNLESRYPNPDGDPIYEAGNPESIVRLILWTDGTSAIQQNTRSRRFFNGDGYWERDGKIRWGGSAFPLGEASPYVVDKNLVWVEPEPDRDQGGKQRLEPTWSAAAWNLMWRKLVPLLDENALRLAVEIKGDSVIYNHFVKNARLRDWVDDDPLLGRLLVEVFLHPEGRTRKFGAGFGDSYGSGGVAWSVGEVRHLIDAPRALVIDAVLKHIEETQEHASAAMGWEPEERVVRSPQVMARMNCWLDSAPLETIDDPNSSISFDVGCSFLALARSDIDADRLKGLDPDGWRLLDVVLRNFSTEKANRLAERILEDPEAATNALWKHCIFRGQLPTRSEYRLVLNRGLSWWDEEHPDEPLPPVADLLSFLESDRDIDL